MYRIMICPFQDAGQVGAASDKGRKVRRTGHERWQDEFVQPSRPAMQSSPL
ncbi:hypothetical protein ASAP_1238 [Asaia bogorensis]|uniref:Uncharacterized protein n=1 Tax=Asaia bogorensis TaxID=91915 RepID=A0A060QF24_9PROT|nr:hypothetical protein ASAP_1238 [Asaia bogorensis]